MQSRLLESFEVLCDARGEMLFMACSALLAWLSIIFSPQIYLFNWKHQSAASRSRYLSNSRRARPSVRCHSGLATPSRNPDPLRFWSVLLRQRVHLAANTGSSDAQPSKMAWREGSEGKSRSRPRRLSGTSLYQLLVAVIADTVQQVAVALGYARWAITRSRRCEDSTRPSELAPFAGDLFRPGSR